MFKDKIYNKQTYNPLWRYVWFKDILKLLRKTRCYGEKYVEAWCLLESLQKGGGGA